MSIRQRLHSLAQWYIRFVSGQGFAMITIICIGVIVGTAVWTKQTTFEHAVPTPPVFNAASAADLWQQSLDDAATPTPAPSKQALVWTTPLSKLVVLQPFDNARMVQSPVTKVWQLHDAVDLAAEAGETVCAMADGVVVQVTEEGLYGVSVTLSHSDGFFSEYAGLSLCAGLREGDEIKAGQTIGFSGSTMLAESDMPPHLHLRVTQGGKAVDPVLLIRRSEQ